MIDATTLTEGGQTADEIAAQLVAFLAEAHTSLDIALYDLRLPGPVGDRIRDALVAASERGVAVRLAYNVDRAEDSTPPKTDAAIVEALPVPTRAIPGEPDLMHHKYVVRDAAAVWTGSTNWTLDSWEREENILVRVASPALAAEYTADFSDLWERRRVEGSGARDPRPITVGDAAIRAWFSPGRGPELSQRIAEAIAGARTRVRIASPLITAAPILRALGARGGDIVTGLVDATQVAQVLRQWGDSPQAQWKGPLLRKVLAEGDFHGKHSIPWGPDTVHDFMHAKVTVCDDTVFAGSFNLSRSGEQNAENVLEIADAALAERLARWIDEIRERYPAITP